MYKMDLRVQPSSGSLLGTRDANTGHHFVSLKGVYARRLVAEGGNSSRSFLAIASNRALRFLFVWFPLFQPRKACSGSTTIMGRFKVLGTALLATSPFPSPLSRAEHLWLSVPDPSTAFSSVTASAWLLLLTMVALLPPFFAA